jgi:predicted alpha/beta-fold hydrolase
VRSTPPPSPPYRPAWWLGPHGATLWGRLVRRGSLPDGIRLERWDTPDGDFLELARLAPVGDPHRTPRLLLLHGLEGGLHSHYARGLFLEAMARGWGMDLLLFRTCGPTPNRLPRSYHSGETSDARFVIERLAEASPAPLGIVGVSLGGNVLAKLLGETGDALPEVVRGAVAVSVPFDLARASRWIGRGFGAVYERAFLRSLVPKALGKIARHPELEPLRTVAGARTLWAFDDHFTAPLHGFADAADYYARASSLPFLDGVRRPLLLLNAVDDPFLPPEVLDDVRRQVRGHPSVHCEFPDRGGHVGFVSGRAPWRPSYYAESRPVTFLAPRLTG